MSHERTPAQARQQRQATNKQQFQTDRAESKTLWYFICIPLLLFLQKPTYILLWVYY